MCYIIILILMQISGTMAKFEDLFQDLDVHTEVMDSTMSAATTLSTPEDQVTGLMKEVLYFYYTTSTIIILATCMFGIVIDCKILVFDIM